MESGLDLAFDYKTLVNELTQGMEKAKQLHFHLRSTSRSEANQDLLVQRILSSYEKALLILKWNASSSFGQAQVTTATSSGPNPSVSVDRSPRSQDSDSKNLRDHQKCNALKKRKLQPTWREQVRANSENGLDGPSDDGCSWRKYGQKDILGAKYPRSYYRCTYRSVRNCLATKQVQRSDNDADVFDITYKCTHTCNESTSTPSPDDRKQESVHTSQSHPPRNQALLNDKAHLRVSTHNSDNDNNGTPSEFYFPPTMYSENHDFPTASLFGDSHPGPSYCPTFLSPATSGTSYFSPANCHFGGSTRSYQHSESDIAEIISARASTDNSPLGGVELPSDMWDLDPNFPFNASGFFT
ncbi:WRKY Transcription Factor [Orobanche minor]